MFDSDFRGYQHIIREYPRHCLGLREKFNYFSCSAHKKQNKQSNKQKWYSLALNEHERLYDYKFFSRKEFLF